MKRTLKRTTALIGALLIFCTLFAANVTQVAAASKPKIAKAQILSVGNVNATTQKIAWKKVSSITGYAVYCKYGTQWKKVATTGKTQFTNTALTPNCTYSYKVRAYKKVSGTTYYGAYSTVVTRKTPQIKVATATMLAVDNVDTTTQTVSWKKIKGVTGYELYRQQGSKWIKVVATGKTKYTIKKLATNKKYFYKVRAYKKTNGTCVYGKYSGTLGKKLTNNLLDLYEPYYCSAAKIVRAPDSVSMGGKTYQNVIDIWNVGYMLFNLEGKYKKMSFEVGPVCGEGDAVSIFSDDELVWSYTVGDGALPKKFTVDIENANKLEICKKGRWTNIGFANIQLYK